MYELPGIPKETGWEGYSKLGRNLVWRKAVVTRCCSVLDVFE